MADTKEFFSDFVVIGGGVAGVCCCQDLAENNLELSVTLVAAKDVIKLVTNHRKVTRALEEICVAERPYFTLEGEHKNLKVICDTVVKIDHENSSVETSNRLIIKYGKLCLCTGANPQLIDFENENIIGIRDLDSVVKLQNKLKEADRILVVGNGGIALELIYELLGCGIIWVIKDKAIGNAFLDEAAAEFLLPSLKEDTSESSHQRKTDTVIFKRRKYAIERERIQDGESSKSTIKGGALGPDWSMNVKLHGKDGNKNKRNVNLEYQCEVKRVLGQNEMSNSNLTCCKLSEDFAKTKEWPLYVELTNGRVYGTDFIISATGVRPNADIKLVGGEFEITTDGGIRVDSNMRTNIPNIYAAGDVCTPSWDPAPHWFQMRLWTQAYQMGTYAARCMTLNMEDKESMLDFCFELFAHVTSFFGYKLCLLGKYNAQGLGKDYELIVRYTKGEEYVKVVLKDGKMMGALLLGETDLEETFENLILNQMDLSRFGESLLDPDVEIDEFFD